jgi:hypothetical protein
MIEYFKQSPSKLLTRIYLAVGFIVFIVIYSYLLKIFQEFYFSTQEYSEVWLSFDAGQFRGLIQPLIQSDQIALFKNVFVLNIFSVSALTLALFALSLMIARSFEASSKMYKIAYAFPVFPILIALLDIIPSIFIIVISVSTLAEFPDWLAYVVSGGYVIRVILLYILIIWFLFALIRFIIRKLKK